MRRKFKFAVLALALSAGSCSLRYRVPEGTGNLPPSVTAELGTKLTDALSGLGLKDLGQLEQAASDIRGIAKDTVEGTDYEFVKARLVRVVDGDTLVVEVGDEEFKVRLIGINTPESVAPPGYRTENSEEGVQASAIVKEALKGVKEVWLQKDVSDTDRYGRLLRYVWLEVPEDAGNIREVEDKMLNGMLVSGIRFPWGEPVAEPTTYHPDVMYSDTFNELYNGALEEMEKD